MKFDEDAGLSLLPQLEEGRRLGGGMTVEDGGRPNLGVGRRLGLLGVVGFCTFLLG